MKSNCPKIMSIKNNTFLINALVQFADDTLNKEPTLSEYLNQLMNEKHLTAPEIYHRAEIDRQVFNRLIQFNRPNQRACRRTLLQISIGLYASESEATKLLATCGYAFTLTSIEDQSFLFCIRKECYSMYAVWEVMEILEENDRELLKNHGY